MLKLIRAALLAAALTAVPACAIVRLDNPVAAARTIDQQAYALISTYAAILEEAGDVVRDPMTTRAVKQGLARAERIATPAVETLKIAVVAYLKADADWRATPPNATDAERRAAALRAATLHLQQAVAAARPPIEALSAALKSAR